MQMTILDSQLEDMVMRVVGFARNAGLSDQDQRDAAQAAVLAVLPAEAPAVAYLIVQQLYPRLVAA